MKNLKSCSAIGRYAGGFYLIAQVFLTTGGAFAQTGKPLPQLGKSPIKEVLAALTLQEKAKLVVGMGFKMPGTTAPPPSTGATLDIGGFKMPPSDPDAYRIPEKVSGAAGRLHGVPRLGIPSITVCDGPAGVRIDPIRNNDNSKTYYATAFPVATLLASSWDTELVKNVGVAFGSEVRDYGVDILLAPALNIHRNPLGGRNFEYYSEDPLLAGKITAAMVKGIQSNGVGTSIKHYAANNQESNRTGVDVVVSERAMREIYLKGFEIAVKEAKPWTVMSSYNKLNGTYTSQRADLITNILRNEWGYKGFVMTDWFGGEDPVAQMAAGNDLIMPGSPTQSDLIIAAVKSGKLSLAQLNKNVSHILNVILQSPSFRKYPYNNAPNLKHDAQVSRLAAEQGMILLKNEDKALPISGAKRVALFGNTSYDIIAGGTGSGDVNKAYTISLLQGLTNAGYTADAGLISSYTDHIKAGKVNRPKPANIFALPAPIPEMAVADKLEAATNNNDVAIITIGRNAGEGNDRGLENDYYLSQSEKDMISGVATSFHARHKKVIVVLNIGGVIEIASWRNHVDGILLAWQPGLEAGNAIADILSGKVNPSGKLATTFPVDYRDVPSAKNFPGTPAQKPTTVSYEEGIYVGYRYYDTFGVKPAYAFGYGLSYTGFTYSKLKLSTQQFAGKLTASVTITNSGKIAGREVVELYLAAPGKTMDKPVKELKAFAKTSLLQPGQSQTLSFDITTAQLASYDTAKSSWVAETGTYKLMLASSSDDVKQSATFKLAKQLIAEKDGKALSPVAALNELKK
ncbi:beta-glucosidase [Mucilaginibacter gracilis]|uniref:Beta-glucosidase n=1 Tax=Mucilaginibacter gracilis TaxID=423350 RepID=A0A495IW26_9SPHI|nr:glycoside hydrolase family 3 C-terminal domain-containing protein [Mucilaginibacter gracilis]RKR80782.1 beta-glucosidase [Mucilaginibacter gracilis]